MKPSDELFKLIKSLTKSEKRFFKLSSSLQSGKKNYIKLFDAIEKQKEYNEGVIKEQFKKENFIKHLPSEKNHLFKLILKSLRSFYSDTSVSSQLKEEIKNIEILYEKALYRECSKLIKRAKKLATNYEKFYYLFELIKWEKSLMEEDYLTGDFDTNLNNLIEEEQDVINKLRNLAEYTILYSKINYVFRRGGYARNDAEKEIVENISKNHLIKGKNTALSKRAAATCYYIKGLCDVVNSDYQASFSNFSKVARIFENYPALIHDIPKQYIKSLSNLLFCYIDRMSYDNFFDLLEKMRAFKNNPDFNSIDLQLTIFTSTYIAELTAYEVFAEFEKGLEIIDEIVLNIEAYKDKINKEEEILFYYDIAYIYFGNNQYREALKWINKVLNDNDNNLRQDIYSFGRLFNLVIHYELENYNLLDYIIKSTSRYYQKRKHQLNRNYQFETVFLKYMKKIVNHSFRNEKEKTLDSFNQLKNELDVILRNDYEKVALQYFDFQTWVESKVEKEDFAALKRKKVK